MIGNIIDEQLRLFIDLFIAQDKRQVEPGMFLQLQDTDAWIINLVCDAVGHQRDAFFALDFAFYGTPRQLTAPDRREKPGFCTLFHAECIDACMFTEKEKGFFATSLSDTSSRSAN